ncbi:MAG: transporter substrate-binding domain-containing protein, partial [Gammaproteobacteria bacterium]
MSFTSTTATLEVFVSRVRSKLHRLATGVLCLMLLACPHAEYRAASLPLPHDTLDRVLARGTLRAVSRVNPATFVVDRHGPSGIEYELAASFARDLGVSLEMIPAANIGDAYAALDAGRADIATSGLTERRAAEVPY